MSNHRFANRSMLAAAVVAAGIAFAAGPVFAAGPAPTPAQVWRLSGHPQCYTVGREVVVRGAVTMDRTHAAVPGAVVRVEYGHVTRAATTDGFGVYSVTFPRTDATTVREIATLAPIATGTHVAVPADSFGGSCSIAGASVGKLQQVK